MKVFISWSGVRSKHIASALRDWLPDVLQAVDPFISTQDIAKGARGNVKIGQKLEEANIGIICLTPENLAAPWILFEAGALSKLSSAYVCTYLFELEPADVKQPLAQFQHTKYTKAETRALIDTINGELPEQHRLAPGRLHKTFERWWDALDEQIKLTPPRPVDEKAPEPRSEKDKLAEVLEILRRLSASLSAPAEPPAKLKGFKRRTESSVPQGSTSLMEGIGPSSLLASVLAAIANGRLTNTEAIPDSLLDDLRFNGYVITDTNNDISLSPRGAAKLQQLSQASLVGS